jgi:molecular chaperone GrpE
MQSSPASEPGDSGGERQAAEATAQQPREGNGGGSAAELEELRGRYEQLEDRYRRALADLDNYRKRAGRDADRRVVESRERVLRDWLEAIDSVERALRMQPPETPLFEGLRAVLDQMDAILDRYGVTRIGEVGEPFDPERHEAVGVVTTDALPDRAVADIARSGFAFDGRVLRPAQVIVAQSAERQAGDEHAG